MVYTVEINGTRYYQVSDVCREIGVSSLGYVLGKYNIKPLTVQGRNNQPVRMITEHELADVKGHYGNDAKRKAAIQNILDGKCLRLSEKVTVLDHPVFGELRTIHKGDKTLYCAADLARILGFSGLPSALSYCHCVEKHPIQVGERVTDMTFVDEINTKRVIDAGKIKQTNDVMDWLFPVDVAPAEEDSAVSTNEVRVFHDSVFGNVRTIAEDDKVLFCAYDIAKSLGYEAPRNAISRHCKGALKRCVGVQTGQKADGTPAFQNVEMSFIPEGDVYRLIVSSHLPEAERFERWLFDEVVPTIRKHGMYATDELLNNPEFAIQVFQKLKEERDRNRELMEANQKLITTNQALVRDTRMWQSRAIVNALVRKYTANTSCNFRLGWNTFYKELAYKKNIRLKSRKGDDCILDRLKDIEWQDAVEVATAMCEALGLSAADVINEVNAERVHT